MRLKIKQQICQSPNVFHIFLNKFIYFILFIFGCVAFSSLHAGGERGLLFAAVCVLLIAMASSVAEHGL